MDLKSDWPSPDPPAPWRWCAPRGAGCEWVYVYFDDDLAPFYVKACGFDPTQGRT